MEKAPKTVIVGKCWIRLRMLTNKGEGVKKFQFFSCLCNADSASNPCTSWQGYARVSYITNEKVQMFQQSKLFLQLRIVKSLMTDTTFSFKRKVLIALRHLRYIHMFGWKLVTLQSERGGKRWGKRRRLRVCPHSPPANVYACTTSPLTQPQIHEWRNRIIFLVGPEAFSWIVAVKADVKT